MSRWGLSRRSFYVGEIRRCESELSLRTKAEAIANSFDRFAYFMMERVGTTRALRCFRNVFKATKVVLQGGLISEVSNQILYISAFKLIEYHQISFEFSH